MLRTALLTYMVDDFPNMDWNILTVKGGGECGKNNYKLMVSGVSLVSEGNMAEFEVTNRRTPAPGVTEGAGEHNKQQPTTVKTRTYLNKKHERETRRRTTAPSIVCRRAVKM